MIAPAEVEPNNMFDSNDYRRQFSERGYFVQENVLARADVAALIQATSEMPVAEAVRRRKGVYGIRNLFDVAPDVVSIATDGRIRQFASTVLGDDVSAVRAIYFDKIPGANWSLFWHQDNVIAVDEKIETAGYSAWSQKAGVWQVQPPVEILSRVITVRIHLDDCDQQNGPLRVLPGSHRHGWLDDKLDDWKQQVEEVVCTVGAGGVVVMCPLTLHASAASGNAEHRRVIHIEYSSDQLPNGLQWRWRYK